MKLSIAIAEDAQGNLSVLAVSKDADTAKKAFESALAGEHEGAVKAALFIRPDFYRRGICEKHKKRKVKEQ